MQSAPVETNCSFLFRHDGACPRRAVIDQLDRPVVLHNLRFRVASAAVGGGCDAETELTRDRLTLI